MKNRSVGIRILLLCLTLTLLLATFAGCDNGKEEPVETKDTPQNESPLLTDENGLLADALPDNLNFNRELTILACQQQSYHFYTEEKGEDVIANVIYDRNEMVKERLGIDINWVFEPGTFNERTTFITKVEEQSKSGSAYDAVICYNLLPYAMAMKGLCANLNDTKYIDLTAPWWPSAYIKTGVYENQIFGLVESCSFGTLERMIATFFNTELVEDKQLDHPYDLVEKYEWTFDKLSSMVKDTWEDKNNDGKKSQQDFFGLVAGGTSPMLDCWFFALGNRYSEVNGDGDLVLLLGDPAVNDFFEKVNTAFATNDILLYDQTGHTKTFVEERAIFYNTIVGMTSVLKDTDLPYGIVPTPKANAADEYYTHLGNTHYAWMIPKDAKSVEESSALLECMASESYRQTNPVYFEKMLKLRYAQDERIAAMYDLVRESIGFDFCYLYSVAFTTATRPNALINSCLTNPVKYTWTSVWESNKTSVESQFQSIINAYFN